MATKRKTKAVVKKAKTRTKDTTTTNIWGWVFILLGAYFLLGDAFGINFGEVIALSFIAVGIVILWKQRQV